MLYPWFRKTLIIFILIKFSQTLTQQNQNFLELFYSNLAISYDLLKCQF